ncbi:MAG TPA: hypothetical protein VF532_19175, partial [Candidatus Angelobacter sp.]
TFVILSLRPQLLVVVGSGILLAAIAASLYFVRGKQALFQAQRVRIMQGLVILLLLAIFLPPNINGTRFRTGLEGSLSAALGQHVTIGQVQYRLLPRPGFVLFDLKVLNKSVSVEQPFIQGDKVTADLRLTSLWRGRLEIGSLRFAGREGGVPTLNLRNANRLMLRSLVQQVVTTPTAPTSQLRDGPLPRFPYIEMSGARISWSNTQGDLFSLDQTNIGLWQSDKDTWHVRLDGHTKQSETQSDGLLRMEAEFRRSKEPQQVPLKLKVALQDIPVAQFVSLMTGATLPVRGDLSGEVQVNGTSHDVHMTANGYVDHVDVFTTSRSGYLQIACNGRIANSTIDISCELPSAPDAPDIKITGSTDLLIITTRHRTLQQ